MTKLMKIYVYRIDEQGCRGNDNPHIYREWMDSWGYGNELPSIRCDNACAIIQSPAYPDS